MVLSQLFPSFFQPQLAFILKDVSLPLLNLIFSKMSRELVNSRKLLKVTSNDALQHLA